MKTGKDAYMTLELLTGIVAIIIPFLLFLTEIYRCEHYVRKMLFAGQARCLERAFHENQGSPTALRETLSSDVELLTFTKRYFKSNWQPPVQHFKKTYTIYTGTGKSGR